MGKNFEGTNPHSGKSIVVDLNNNLYLAEVTIIPVLEAHYLRSEILRKYNASNGDQYG